jgi:hypothetical protein
VRDDLVHLLVNWLSDANTESGVNAILPTIARRPNDPPPEAITAVLSDITDDRIAMGKELLDGDHPALVVYVGEPELRPLGGDKVPSNVPNVAFSVTYAQRHELGADANVAAGYTMEAVRRSLNALNRAKVPVRRVRDTELTMITAIAEGRIRQAIGRSALVAAVVGRARARDLTQD